MVKKKEILSGKWVVIDSDDHIYYYPDFLAALKHPGSRVSIMAAEYYETAYKEIDSDTDGIEKLFVEMSAQQVYDKYIKPLRDNPDYKLPETGAMLFYTKKHSEGYDIDKIILTSLDEDYCISLIESVMDLEDFAGWPFGR